MYILYAAHPGHGSHPLTFSKKMGSDDIVGYYSFFYFFGVYLAEKIESRGQKRVYLNTIATESVVCHI